MNTHFTVAFQGKHHYGLIFINKTKVAIIYLRPDYHLYPINMVNLITFCHHFEVHDCMLRIVFQASPENAEGIGVFYA